MAKWKFKLRRRTCVGRAGGTLAGFLLKPVSALAQMLPLSAWKAAVPPSLTLWAWGDNAGQVGDGTFADRSSPVQAGAGTTWSTISAGAAHSLALKSDGTLWGYGANGSSQLGILYLSPTLVE